MAEWTDKASGLTNSDFAYTVEKWHLNSMINDRCSQIHRIDEDIDRLEQGLNDIGHSIDSFSKAADDMQLLESEVTLVFRGESGEAFLKKITSYKNYCLKRIENMHSLKSNYERQIRDLRYQKEVAQRVLERLRERLERLRNRHCCNGGGGGGSGSW